MVLPIVIAITCFLPLLFILFSKWRYTYWNRKGIAQLTPEFFYGDVRKILKAQASVGETFNDIYTKFKKSGVKFGGVYFVFRPTFVPVDPQIIKDIFQKDFAYFNDRGVYNHENDILTQNLFGMEGEAWKNLRAKLTPTFTSSRMRMMFETLWEKNKRLEEVANECVTNGGKINAKDVTSRYTTDVIGSCAFGIECDSLKDPNCEFRIYGNNINIPRVFKQWMENTFPRRLLGYTGYRSFPDIEDFFRNLVKGTIEYREKNNIYRKDFMHLMIQLRNRGVITDDGKITMDPTEKGILTDDEIIAQCFLFFGAGFDTSSATMAFALYELAKHPHIQNKVRKEMREVVTKYNGVLTYDGAKELLYTEKVIKETLRKYPPAPVIPRVCTKTYQIPGTDVVIEEGTHLRVPAWGFHMDPDYFPNPEVFDPGRFDEKVKRPEFTYFPFGEGPRMCLGARFGMMQVKAGLVGLVKDYQYEVCEDTPNPITYVRAQFLLHAREDIWLRISKVPT